MPPPTFMVFFFIFKIYLWTIFPQEIFHRFSSVTSFPKNDFDSVGRWLFDFRCSCLDKWGGEMQDKLEKVRGKNDFFVAILALSRYGKTFIRVILNVRSFFKNKFYTDNVVFKTNRNAWKGFFFHALFLSWFYDDNNSKSSRSNTDICNLFCGYKLNTIINFNIH